MKIRAVPDWVWAALVGVTALGLRLWYVWQVHALSLVAPEDLDPGFYYNWGKKIAAGDWRGQGAFVQSPLYAYLLGLLMKVIGTGVTGILVVQAFVGTGTVLMTYLLGRRLFGHVQGLIAALLIAFYGPFVFFEGMVMKTFLAPFLTLALLLALDRAWQAAVDGRRALRMFGAAGLVYGLTTLDRDNFILLAPVLAALVFWMGRRSGGAEERVPGGASAESAAGGRALAAGSAGRGLRAAAAFTLGTVLVIAPVTLRNWVVAHEFVLLTTGGGEVFFIGNNADANGLYVPPPFVRPDPLYEHADFVARASEIGGRQMTAMQSSWFWFGQGLQYIKDEPLGWIRLLGRKTIHFWNSFELPDNLDYAILQRFSPLLEGLNVTFPPPGSITLVVPAAGSMAAVRLHLFATFGTLAPLGLCGIWLTRRRWRRLVPLYVVLFGYMATVLLFFNFGRFRVPVVPILAIFGAETVLALGRGLRRLGRLAKSLAMRSGDLAARAREVIPGWSQAVALVLLALCLVGANVEWPRGVVPAIEQALVTGNAYYALGKDQDAQQSYLLGLLLLGEGPAGEQGDAELRRHFGAGVSRDALAKEVEAESIARGPQFKGIHIGLHHGLGLTLISQAQQGMARGDRVAAMRQVDQAMGQFAEALKLAPAYLLSIRKMAVAFDLKGDHASAVDWLRKGVDLWPDDRQARTELSEALFRSGEYRDALQQLDTLRQGSGSAPAPDAEDMGRLYFNRALIYADGLNDPGKALYNLEKVLEVNPDYPQAAAVRRQILNFRARGVQPIADEPGPGRTQTPPAEAASSSR